MPNTHDLLKQEALSNPIPHPPLPPAVDDAPPQILSGVASPPNRAAQQAIKLTNAASKLAVQQRLRSQSSTNAQPAVNSAQTATAGTPAAAAAAAKAGAVLSGVAADGGGLQGMSTDALAAVVAQRTQAVRTMKAAKKVFEVDPEAKAAAKALQEA